jgi:hypothetical protein
MKIMKALLSLVLLAIATAPPAAADEPVKIAVSPMHSFAPSLMRIRVRVEPNAANRMLQIIVDSEDFYRRTDMQLDGDQSAAMTQMELRSLPGGEYEVRAVVIDVAGHARASAVAHASVFSPTHEPPTP